MIEQSVEEVAESMAEYPKDWAQQYLDLIDTCNDLQQQNEKMALLLLPTGDGCH